VNEEAMQPVTFAALFQKLAEPAGPSPELMRAAFDAILAGAWTPAQVAGLVVALRVRGETPEIITAAVRAMREAMVPVDHGLGATLDTCGTGGDGMGTLNISTAAAVVVAASGVIVAKHGNRAASSKAGSADVLEALGIPLDVAAKEHATILKEAGITFLFAPAHHPAMRHAAQARRELGIRTIFNLLGPLANPARATHQLIGTYDHAIRCVMAETLRALGTQRAWIVRGDDGLDEVSPSGPTRVTELDGGSICERVVTPEDFGLAPILPSAIAGGDAEHNARAIESILQGQAHPARAAVVLNAAAALVVARSLDLRSAADEADRAITSGGALATLERWRDAAKRARAR
jgi:anthranilate phosphoribosyltransferase